jgi:hypothetical protein
MSLCYDQMAAMKVAFLVLAAFAVAAYGHSTKYKLADRSICWGNVCVRHLPRASVNVRALSFCWQ